MINREKLHECSILLHFIFWKVKYDKISNVKQYYKSTVFVFEKLT